MEGKVEIDECVLKLLLDIESGFYAELAVFYKINNVQIQIFNPFRSGEPIIRTSAAEGKI